MYVYPFLPPSHHHLSLCPSFSLSLGIREGTQPTNRHPSHTNCRNRRRGPALESANGAGGSLSAFESLSSRALPRHC